ncbi:MAG: AAA family ATPase [Clostridiaceae bacterium]|nr:AAA family ATPase [Clostridiaceae bacterium]
MDEVKKVEQTEQTVQKPESLENGTYEVIKNRLLKHGNDLDERLKKLNDARKQVFGSIDTTIIGSERLITDNNCVPRDMVPVGTSFIFGYNVYMGLKAKVELEDVFAMYEYKEHTFQKIDLVGLKHPQFIADFNELYTYYKNTFFAKFTLIEPHLYMIFQTGKSAHDIKAFKWLIEEGKITYIDNRSDHEVRFQSKNEFDWVRTRREDHRDGLFPHVSIQDRVFVETVDGDLTIKVEDNTDTGKGIYSEPVEDKDQTLDDAEIYYTILGNIVLLKIRPYKEKEFRYFIFNDKLKSVVRIDDIKEACMLLPDDQGLIFPKGYYLKSGDYKLFDVPVDQCIFEQKDEAPNGEDYQYFFYNIDSGSYLVYSYNVIEQTVETPIVCSGFAHFDNGEMIVFNAGEEPRKNHMVQIWQTPFFGKNYVLETKENNSFLYKIGNKDIVNCMADCKLLCNLIQKGEGYADIYVDILKEASQIVDSYFWISDEEAYDIKSVLINIKEASSSAVAEFEKVTKIRNATASKINEVDEKTQKLLREIEYGNFDSIADYVSVLANVRNIRGEIVSLKDLRYTNLSLVESLEAKVKEKNELFSQKCVDFLLDPEGLKPYTERVNQHQQQIDKVEKTSTGKELSEDMAKTSSDLEMLIDIVSNFNIEDPTKTTEIIENISLIYSQLNQAKAKLKTRMGDLASVEGTAQFNSQMKLLDQAVVNYLDIADTTEKCEDYLGKVMIQIDELEGKFADFDDYVVKLSEKREELYNAFEARKQVLLDNRSKKVATLVNASDRVLTGIINRLKGFKTINEINGYFASDIMIEKVRDTVDQLEALGDNVKADEIEGRLKTIKEDAVRQLKDKQDLYVDGRNVIKFGNKYFSVNTQKLEISVVQKDGELYFHISGTDFWDKVCNEKVSRLRHVWEQSVVSENNDVYRAQYLTYKIFTAALNKETVSIDELYSYSEEQLLEFIRKFMEPRYQEAYSKGIHDTDCRSLLRALINLHKNIDLLIFNAKARAMAQLFWTRFRGPEEEKFKIRLKEMAKVSKFFKTEPDLSAYIPSIKTAMQEAFSELSFIEKELIPQAALYLCKELMRGDTFVISLEADEIYKAFIAHLKEKKAIEQFDESMKNVENDLEGLFYLVQEWLKAFLKDSGRTEVNDAFYEAIIILVLKSYNSKNVIQTRTRVEVEGLVGDHPTIAEGKFVFTYTEFLEKMRKYESSTVRDFEEYQNLKKELTQNVRKELKLDEFKSDVLSSFVRSKLIDKVYLPIIGDNLAKQIGVVGEDKRTDLMGMLLLISPPGYGKTTLMEYVASRLGITMVKINGPAIGHEVVSLDPALAKSTGAKEELKKLNLAFKMGNNVMIYIDDIQHCSPEFLQKFISLCDGQRRIEGVYNGVGQTYDLRGKKVVVVMAGNPYTESGTKFQIPDMLANRADVYNLGDMLRENEDAFMLSYIENSLTSNPVLNKLATRSQKDVYTLIEIAQKGDREGLDFEGNYTAEEINEFVEVIKKLLKVRDIVLKVNLEYIRSAAQADEYRNEPAFKLQGSYRNMNKIAEKVLAVMNDEELDALISGTYENDAQTLSTGSEANMLKWKELVGCLSEQEEIRWKEIKTLFNKNKLVKGDDKIGQAVLMLNEFSEKLGTISEVLSKGIENSINEAQSLTSLANAVTQLKDVHGKGVTQFLDRIDRGRSKK